MPGLWARPLLTQRERSPARYDSHKKRSSQSREVKRMSSAARSISPARRVDLFVRVCSTPGMIRTSDRQIRNLLLYPTELRGRVGRTARFRLKPVSSVFATKPASLGSTECTAAKTSPQSVNALETSGLIICSNTGLRQLYCCRTITINSFEGRSRSEYWRASPAVFPHRAGRLERLPTRTEKPGRSRRRSPSGPRRPAWRLLQLVWVISTVSA